MSDRFPETGGAGLGTVVPARDESVVDAERLPGEGRWDEMRRFAKTQPVGVASLLVIVAFVVLAVAAPLVAPFDPVAQDRTAFLVGPSGKHVLGTDDLGRDILSRIIHGSRISLYVGAATIAVSMVIGTLIGIGAGYIGGAADGVLQGIIDAVLSIPPLVLALFVAALLGPSIRNVILALSILEIPRFARIARGEMQRVRSEDFVDAAVALGASKVRVMLRHGLPNILPSLIIVASLGFGIVIVAEAALSFLGIGTPPPNPSWGLMLSQGTTYFQTAPWLVVFPGLAISLAVLAFNLFGDALRDFLDPKLVK
ncbi:MAG: ABC transporter permease subunit [Streptosporangiales bacterium]|nr:ABC transporter permease subunit [Streptosporangiales bacterium]